MSEIDIKNAPDEKLEEILRMAINTHVDGSEFNRAKIELELRRSKKTFDHQQKVLEQQEKVSKIQEEMLITLKTRLDNLTRLLALIASKPLKSVIIGGIGAVAIGVLIELIAKLLEKILHF